IISRDLLCATSPVVGQRHRGYRATTCKTHPWRDDRGPQKRQHRPHDTDISRPAVACRNDSGRVTRYRSLRAGEDVRHHPGSGWPGPGCAPGSVFGLLGPNSAGKTTAIRILATLIKPDAGAARVLGHDVRKDPRAVRSRISLTGQFATLDTSLSGMENLLLQARLLGLSRRAARTRAAELLDAFGLADAAPRTVNCYSGGLQRPGAMPAMLLCPP